MGKRSARLLPYAAVPTSLRTRVAGPVFALTQALHRRTFPAIQTGSRVPFAGRGRWTPGYIAVYGTGDKPHLDRCGSFCL